MKNLDKNNSIFNNQDDSNKNTPFFNNFDYFDRNAEFFNNNDDQHNKNDNGFPLIDNKKKTQNNSNRNLSPGAAFDKHKIENLNFLSEQKENTFNNATNEFNLLSINELRKDNQFNVDLLDAGEGVIKTEKVPLDKNLNQENVYFFEREEFKNINLFDNDLNFLGYYNRKLNYIC